MKLFVGYHFGAEDEWVHELVLPLVRAFGFEAVTGEEVYGGRITDEVISRIRASQGLIGFVTRRGKTNEASRWVTDELAVAVASNGVQVLEVREVGLDDQLGVGGDRQHIDYDPAKPERCLVDIAAALGDWARTPAPKPVRVIPQTVVEQIAPLLEKPGFRCTYRWKVGPTTSAPTEVELQPVLGGLMLDATDVPAAAYVQVRIEGGGKAWVSQFEPIDWWNVLLALQEV
jgi:hypothetical protein